MAKEELYGLVLAGGGSQGAYQVGVLKYIHEHFCKGEESPFQIFTGTSIGSLNTTFLASHSFDAKESRNLLEKLWLEFDVPAWHENLMITFLKSLGRHWFRPKHAKELTWSLLDPEPLRETIKKIILRENIEKAFLKGTTRGIGISGTEILSGKTCWFQEGPSVAPWNFLRSVGREEPIHPIHVEASCSAPLFFPPVKIGDHYFADGSMSVKTPLNPAVNMGAIKILCIATDKPLPSELPQYKSKLKPRISNFIKMMDNQISYDHAIEQAGTLKFINYFSEMQKANKIADPDPDLHIFEGDGIYPENYSTTDVFLFYPSRRIRHSSVYPLGDELVMKKKKRFVFTRESTEELIAHGYEDAKAKHESLNNFFNPPEKTSFFRFFRRKPKGNFKIQKD